MIIQEYKEKKGFYYAKINNKSYKKPLSTKTTNKNATKSERKKLLLIYFSRNDITRKETFIFRQCIATATYKTNKSGYEKDETVNTVQQISGSTILKIIKKLVGN